MVALIKGLLLRRSNTNAISTYMYTFSLSLRTITTRVLAYFASVERNKKINYFVLSISNLYS